MVAPEVSAEPIRVLIVEDDVTMEPLWQHIIETATPGALIDWVTSVEAAPVDRRYDLVIADIFLAGEQTGLDLWERIGETTPFILMSVITAQRLKTLALNRPLPSYIQKPLDPSQCIETVRAVLRSSL